ncbi:PASTA domain-containing protein [Actinoplanes sp. TRM 88003]|uniref:PASTA domain-containing protein n=1 Tax=Paractinoplanes aksuensis TaxID=2939490 RepID=A0ABT1DZF6_9ACTN|nr:PASTA domain-containing protein [Actinoplanes aksuensis]MCO8276269.1 PASTA domain-containing protein [Actinoplanes aksuensis]
MRTRTLTAITFGLVVAVAGCSSDTPGSTTAAPGTTAATTPSVAPVEATETAQPGPTVSAKPSAAATRKAAAAPAKVKVPNGVGLDYQSAQDLWRAAGLHVAPAIDATGANRLPVIDANWVVLSQNLKAGTKVNADSFITAKVKKYTDN